jgi:hypothetical protein
MAAKGAGGTSRVVGMVSSLVAGSIARRVLTFGWKRVAGKAPPTDPHDPDVALKEALAWSIVVGVGMEAARLLVTRAVASRMRSAHADAEGTAAAAE